MSRASSAASHSSAGFLISSRSAAQPGLRQAFDRRSPRQSLCAAPRQSLALAIKLSLLACLTVLPEPARRAFAALAVLDRGYSASARAAASSFRNESGPAAFLRPLEQADQVSL